MRGDDRQQAAMLSSISPAARVPYDHPLRAIRAMVEAVLKELSPQLDRLYAQIGRPSIVPEKLLRALLLQVLYTVRRERRLMEQRDYNVLFRWFVGLNVDDPVWEPTTVTKNRERLRAGDVAPALFAQVLAQARAPQLLSAAHCTVDGTVIAAWAGQQSVTKNGPPALPDPPDDPGHPRFNFRGERRTHAPHASTTDPEARLDKKAQGPEATRCDLGHVQMEHRHGVVVDTRLTPAFVSDLRELPVTPQVTPHTTGRTSAIDGRTTRHPGYAISQRKRPQVAEICGWLQTVGLLRKTRHRGLARVGWMLTCAAAVYNRVRMRTLVAVA